MILMDKFDLNAFFSRVHKDNFWKNLLLFVLGVFISALAFNLFFNNYSIIPTGSGGLALIIREYININISILILVIGLICMMIGLIFYGFKYALKMLIITFLSPFFVSVTDIMARNVDFEDTSLLLIVIFGGGMIGFANGLIRNSGYSTGGFGVIFDLMKQYLHISIGTASIIINSILIILCSFTFGIESAIYSIISLLVSSYLMDRLLFGVSNNKVFYIVTTKPYEVRDFIVSKLHYSVTLISGRGGYSNKKKKVLMSVISTREYVLVKELLKEIDPKVFFLIVDTYESSVKRNL